MNEAPPPGFPPPPETPRLKPQELVSAFNEVLQKHLTFLNEVTNGNATLAIGILECSLRGYKRLEERVFEKQARDLDAFTEHLKQGGKVN